MTELTRRQMRELERSGRQLPVPEVNVAVSEMPPVEPPLLVTGSQEVSPAPPVITSRRQLREAAGAVVAPEVAKPTYEAPEPLVEKTEEKQEVTPEFERPAAIAPRRLAPVPPVGSRRALREPASEVVAEAAEPVALEAIEVEIPEDGFRGANYLGEPSTQSIMLEIAPEAIALPLDTGEVFTTGSIAILPEAPGPSTGGLDGAELDSTEDAVTGVLSVVDPVSAKTLIDERSPMGVVPEGVLRKGWWRPWVVGAVSLVMALAAILASITILNALGE